MKYPAMAASLVFCAMAFTPAFLSAAQTSGKKLEFEVASIHRTSPQDARATQTMKPLPNGTGYMTQNFSLKAMIATAYRLPMSRVEGGPDWIDSDRYDIQARADKSYGMDDLHTMFKNLLSDRFGLKYHIVTRESSVYDLVVDKAGIKMKVAEPSQTMQVPIVTKSPGDCVATGVSMSYLAFFLSQPYLGTDHPVIDKTGLSGTYNFTLTFIPQFPGVPSDQLAPELQNRPTLPDAVREQLGLRLQLAKGPVDSLIIDAVSRPSDN